MNENTVMESGVENEVTTDAATPKANATAGNLVGTIVGSALVGVAYSAAVFGTLSLLTWGSNKIEEFKEKKKAEKANSETQEQ